MDFSYRVIEIVPRHVFRTARTTCVSSTSVIVELSDGTVAGIGEAAPSRFYGEDEGTVVAALERMRPAVEASAHESQLMAELMSRSGPGDPSARAALEIAAHDMAAKRFGVPLFRYFELDSGRTPITSVTVGLDEPDVMLKKALELSGFPVLKVKLDSDTDLAIVSRIREATGATIWVDANCAWETEEAIEKIETLAGMGVASVEQPVKADNLEGLRRVKLHCRVPIMADESVPTSAAIPKVADCVDGIVIKLMKCGGLVEAVKMARDARELGLKTMLGCMMETSIGITAAAHISPLVDHADLDSAFLLERDPYVGARIEAGRLILPERAGLGVEAAPGPRSS